ncbi:MAG: ribosome maturation factor RimP [Actinomycetota bacterium]|nr:ribosome maturation factor RimP [Actinomycetota bacterium]
MTRHEALAEVRATCEAILAQRRLDLVEFAYIGESIGKVLRITLERGDQPVSLDEIADVSEEISRALDIEDPIQGRYTLEVASAGLERPLLKPADYERFNGRDVKVRLEEAVEGRRNFKGRLRASNAQTFVLELEEGSVVELPYGSVAKANLAVDWEQEMKKRPERSGSLETSGGNL